MQLINKKITQIIIIFVLFGIFLLGFFFDFGKYFSLALLKEKQSILLNLIQENYLLYYISFFIIYILVTAFALPIAIFKTLLAGALFGFIPGLILTSFASTIGSSLCFSLSRYSLRDYVQKRFSKYINKINQGIDKEGNYYLLFLRLSPVFPFFIINLVFGLTKMTLKQFYLISQIGMLPATIIFINAGVQLGNIQSVSEILSLKIILSLSLIGLFPLIIKKIYEKVKK